MASPETKAASNYPVSMGPGARPIRPGEGSTEQQKLSSSFRQFAEQRHKYSVVKEPSGIRIGYELKDTPRNHFIAFENAPIGGFMQFMLFSGDVNTTVTGTFIIDTIRGIENMSGKMLTQTQAEGVALHASKRMLYSTSVMYLATFGGAYLAWRGRKDMKFPFIKPRPPERYNNFPNRYIPVLRDQFARTMWHITRGFVWMGLGVVLLSPVFNSMGGVSMMTGLYRDERTQAMMKGLKGSLNRVDANTAQRGAPGQTAPPEDAYRSDDGSRQFSGSEDSSSAYGSGDYVEPSFDTSYADSGLQEAQPSRQQSLPSQQTRGSPSRSTQDRGSGDSDFFFDDASPTAGNDPDMGTPRPYQSSASTWERLRRGGRGPSGSQTGQPQRQPLPSRLPPREQEESFSYSGGDEEKAVAKQQAQKEFDAMLEKERRESGSGDYDRGMRAAQQGQESPGGGESESAWSRRRRG